MADWSARMDAQEAARNAQLQRVAAIQAAQAQEAQVRAVSERSESCSGSVSKGTSEARSWRTVLVLVADQAS